MQPFVSGVSSTYLHSSRCTSSASPAHPLWSRRRKGRSSGGHSPAQRLARIEQNAKKYMRVPDDYEPRTCLCTCTRKGTSQKTRRTDDKATQSAYLGTRGEPLIGVEVINEQHRALAAVLQCSQIKDKTRESGASRAPYPEPKATISNTQASPRNTKQARETMQLFSFLR